MTAGDEGVVLRIDAAGYVMTGAVCTLIAAPKSPARGSTIRLTPLVVSDDGLTAEYTTTGTDFTIGGEWSLQLEVLPSSSSDKFTSPEVPFWIFPHL